MLTCQPLLKKLLTDGLPSSPETIIVGSRDMPYFSINCFASADEASIAFSEVIFTFAFFKLSITGAISKQVLQDAAVIIVKSIFAGCASSSACLTTALAFALLSRTIAVFAKENTTARATKIYNAVSRCFPITTLNRQSTTANHAWQVI